MLGYFKFGHAPNHKINSFVQENSHLNFFAKWLNGMLHISYEKYPTNSFLQYNPYMIYHSNIYPAHLQPPIWYPYVFIPQGQSPVNQQQIINLPQNPNDVQENYQESSSQNTQEIHNNLNTQNRVETLEPIKNVEPTNKTQSKIKSCESNDFGCIEAVESETATEKIEDPVQNVSNLNIAADQKVSTNSDDSNSLPEVTTISSQDSNQTLTNLTANNITSVNVTNFKDEQNFTKPSSYPNAYYQNFDNVSAYQHISITESPEKDVPIFLEYPVYENSNSYSTNYANSFRPMRETYYDSGYVYDNFNEEKYNTKQEDSEFVPVNVPNHI